MTRRLARPYGMILMSEAAKMLGKTPDATRQLFKRSGQAVKFGGRWFVPLEAVRALLPHRYDLGGPNAARGRRLSMRELAQLQGKTVDAASKWCRRNHVGDKLGGRRCVDTAVLVEKINGGRDPLDPFVPPECGSANAD